MRKLFLILHRWLALPFGIIIFLMCLTGALLVFEKEIIQGLNYNKYHITFPTGATHLADSVLLEKVESQLSADQILLSLEVSDEPTAPARAVIAGMGRGDFLVNPYTGEVYGRPLGSDFFVTIRLLHRYLLHTPEGDPHSALSLGRIVVGLTAIAMTIIILTGLILWWPRSKAQLQRRLSIKTNKGFHRFAYDSHVTLGFFAAIFLLLMALTGPAWTFGWYRQGAQTILAHEEQHTAPTQSPSAASPLPGQHSEASASTSNSSPAPFSKVRHVAQHQHSPKSQFHTTLQSLHFGRWGGLFTRILYFLAALIGATLPCTGYYLWWKRKH